MERKIVDTKYISSDMKKKIKRFKDYQKDIEKSTHEEAEKFLIDIGVLNEKGELNE